jgi:hypothetical protein
MVLNADQEIAHSQGRFVGRPNRLHVNVITRVLANQLQIVDAETKQS